MLYIPLVCKHCNLVMASCLAVSNDDSVINSRELAEGASPSPTTDSSLIKNLWYENRREICDNINPTELVSYLITKEILTRKECRLMKSMNVEEKNDFIMDAVENQDGDAYDRFLCCLDAESNHLGHSYIASLLRGKVFAKKADIQQSMDIRERLKQHMPAAMDIDVDALIPFLFSRRLLTNGESKQLKSEITNNDKAITLFTSILESKGPTGYLLFAQSLEAEVEHPVHHDLLAKITSCASISSSEKKRPALMRTHSTETEIPQAKLPKQMFPNAIFATGTLKSDLYFKYSQEVNLLNNSGHYDKAQQIVDKCEQSGDKELYVAVLLRSCEVLVNREEFQGMVEENITKAKRICQDINTDNGTILWSRCQYAMAHLCRYTNRLEEAVKCIGESSMIIHHNNVQGEDRVLVSYEQGCVNLCSLAMEAAPNKFIFETTVKCFKDASEHALNGDFGLFTEHHRIRLAQLYLRSSPSHAGTSTSPEFIKEARTVLDGLNGSEERMAPRTQTLFYIARSDLHRNAQEHDLAFSFARRAHSIASEKRFDTELESINGRFAALQIQPQQL